MVKGIYTSTAGMSARWREQETVANNLANVHTAGFKADRLTYRDVIRGVGGEGSEGLLGDVPPGTLHIYTDLSAGGLEETHNPLDLAVLGRGFFVVSTPEGLRYTRAGNFSRNAFGELVDAHGNSVLAETDVLSLPEGEITVTPAGDVAVNGTAVGRLKVVDFPDQTVLLRAKFGFQAPDDAEPIPAEGARIVQGVLEKSNVNPLTEMVRMIELSRIYESCQKAVQAQDETLNKAVNEVGR